MKNLFVAIIGLPDSLRDTFIDRILTRHSTAEVVKSYTTAVRMTDRDYLYHEFVTEDTFREMRRNGAFFHVEQRDTGLYGTRLRDILDVLTDGHCICLFSSISNAKLGRLRPHTSHVEVVRPLQPEDVPMGIGDMPHGTFFQIPRKGGNDDPN